MRTEETKNIPEITGYIKKYASFLIGFSAIGLIIAGIIKGIPENNWLLILSAVFVLYFCSRLVFIALSQKKNQTEKLDKAKSAEVGVIVLSMMYLFLAMSGWHDSPLVPLLYLSITVIVAFFGKLSGVITVVLAVLVEILVPLVNHDLFENPLPVITRILFILSFAVFYPFMKSIGAGIDRGKAKSELKQIIGSIEDTARRYRLNDSTTPDRIDQEYRQKKDLSTYFEMHEVLQDILKLLAVTLNSYTACVLWYDPAKNTLKVVEAISASNVLSGHEFSANQGVLHPVVAGKTPLKAKVEQWTKNTVSYYRAKEPIFALCAVPILDDDRLLGILAVDRTEEITFSEDDLEAIEIGAKQIKRAVVNENLLRRLDKSQNEYLHLAESSKALSKTLSFEDVLKVTLDTTHNIAPFDFGAVVMTHPPGQEYEIVALWPANQEMQGMTFSDKHNLIDWVIRKNQSLVYNDFNRLPKRPIIFMRDEKLNNIDSLLIVPLNVQAQTSGAFVLASSHPNFFSDDLKHIFEIISNQIAVSLENAEMVHKLEQLAVTDGLTGLYNKRFFQGRMEEIVSRAERYEQNLALLMMDIDHFKTINDTYGHPTGDVVLREVSGLLSESMRKIDIVARWGGEEFIVLLDSTDEYDAIQKAEQLRESIADLVFESDLGDFSVHVSFGIAVFPNDTRNIEELVEKADAALYQSKKGGRNRCTMYSSL